MVIFGASGDLTRRKLVPALYSNYRKERLGRVSQIVGFAQTEWTNDAFRSQMGAAVEEFSDAFDPEIWKKFAELLHYHPGDLNAQADYEALANRLTADEEPGAGGTLGDTRRTRTGSRSSSRNGSQEDTMGKIHQLHELGQSIWLDYIRRSFTRGGELAALVEEGLRGVTSNPTIFDKAISGGDEYDDEFRTVMQDTKDPEGIYEHLAVTDIREAADTLLPVYEQSSRADGFVSLEVSPNLAYDTEGTIAAAKRLFETVDRPNLMIKIPATREGIPAIRETIGAGINVNVTLIFSISNYESVVDAYLAGLEAFAGSGGDPSNVASVASFFVSRIDVAVEERLAGVGAGARAGAEITGSIAVDNARLAYVRFKELFSGPRWERLASSGARPQRLLWASTGTKSDRLPDTFYVDELIGGPTVNTVPPATLDAFLDHGTVAATLAQGVEEAHERFTELSRLGIDLEEITTELQAAGVKSFAESFASLLDGVREKRSSMAAE